MDSAVVAIPVRSFDGMSRLATTLSSDERESLVRSLAEKVVAAVVNAGARPAIVTADAAVATWGRAIGTDIVADPGTGLDAAAHAAVAFADPHPWVILHADLPLIGCGDVAAALARIGGRPVLAPSHDGGTSMVASVGRGFPFSYGIGSFRRHLAALRGEATVLISPGLAFDVDGARELDVAHALAGKTLP